MLSLNLDMPCWGGGGGSFVGFQFLALLDCVSRAIAMARASVVVRKMRFLRNRKAN